MLLAKRSKLRFCPYCKRPLIKVFKGNEVYCAACNAKVIKFDETKGLPYIKCWHCGYEPIYLPKEGTLCPKCQALVF